MNIKNQIEKYKEEAFSLLDSLISCKSVLDEYMPNSDAPFGIQAKKALEILLNKAKEDGFITKNVDNYAGHIEFGSGNEILGVLAHLDVVPVNESEWDSNPFKLTFKNDKMYGRGTLDDKGPLVSAYIAMKILKDNGFIPNKRVRLIAGCDEESGSRCLKHYLEYEEKPHLGFSPDASFPVIFGEKGMLSFDIVGNLDGVISEFICGDRYNVVPSCAKCKLKVNLENEFYSYLNENNYQGEYKDGYYIIYGVAAHAMCPENGVNAAYLLFDFINRNTNSKLAKFVSEYFLYDTRGVKLGIDVYDEEMKDLTCNFAVCKTEGNSFKIGVNCRVPLDSHLQLIEDKVTIIANKYGYNYKELSKSKRHYVNPNGKLVKTLMNVYSEVTNDYENKPFTIGGGTYAREIGNSVAFGPTLVGREDVCHIANEYMYLEDFFTAIEIYAKAIYELTK